MGERTQRQPPGSAPVVRHSSWILLAIQYTTFVLLLHYSRIMPPEGGKRYLTSTAVVLNEVVKLAVSLTMALYEVSTTAPPSMPATSLFFSVVSAVFSGDSWKLALPACLYTLANSLQYIGLSNLSAATFQVTYQLKLVFVAIFSLGLLRKTVPLRNWALLLLLLVGVAFVQLQDGGPKDESALEEETARIAFPRSLEEWREVQAGGNVYKRSATYEGIEEDMLTALPRLNGAVGLLATLGACAASALAGVYFERVLRDSAKSTSPWVRNLQLALYSIFPALFIGVAFLDGEQVAANGFFQGYNWVVWSTVIVQALGGIATSFSMIYANTVARSLATTASIVLSTVGSICLFEFEVNGYFLLGTAVVLAATYLYGEPSTGYPWHAQAKMQGGRPPPIRIDSYEKEALGQESPVSPPNEISIKLPTTPFLSDAGLSTSRPTSPGQVRISSSRNASGSYFDENSHDA
ncbi:putative UDP-galactose transporter [Aspergillus ruber CBS 135680]|uniref:UDP-galactose transporter n=1 Tax=Aspergillus ruber (strain CBS 135680) TaxID=1388766 RepID=A0A017S266_ASPRC|nr:UDP-galactose transporter [Aspergillus ruber CBS 135680]EYE91022.1 UDP-galactose transporter [Aspergillus ruber CBS 135680]